MTLKMNMKNTIANVVESMFPKFSDKHLGFHMIVDFRYEDMGFDKSGNKRVREPWKDYYRIELLFIRPSNYTKVLGRVMDNNDYPITRTKNEVILNQYSNHDSCWRSDGFSEFFQTFIKAIKKYEEERNEDLTKYLDEWHGFAIAGNPKFVEIEYANFVDPKDRYNSKYKVKIKKELSVKEAANFMPDKN